MKTLAYNVAAFDKVLGLATQVGDSYKPGNKSIERTALTTLLEESRKSVTAVLKAEGDLATAINQRQQAFDKLPLLGIHIMSLAASGGMDDKDLHDLNKLRKRFRSQPFKGNDAIAVSRPGENTAATSVPSPEPVVRKNRQLSYDNKVVILESIVKFLEDKASYNPTEPAYTIEGLKDRLATLQAHNEAVAKSRSTLVSVRSQAKSMIFDRKAGMFGKATMMKKYLKTIVDQHTDLYRSISKVKFKTEK